MSSLIDSSEFQNSSYQENRESSPYRAPHSIILRPKVISQSLGFELDEKRINESCNFIVKRVEAGSPSAVAGLKEGDKITKINGKSTTGMSFEDFLNEVAIAQQIHERHNMIHLMVMRRTQKASQSAAATASATTSAVNEALLSSASSMQQAQQTTTPLISSSASSSTYQKDQPKPNVASQEFFSETSTASNVSVVKISQPGLTKGEKKV